MVMSHRVLVVANRLPATVRAVSDDVEQVPVVGAQPPLSAARIVVLSDAYFGATIFVKVIVSPVRSPLTMTRSPANVFRSAKS
jgi:hypothetical protein